MFKNKGKTLWNLHHPIAGGKAGDRFGAREPHQQPEAVRVSSVLSGNGNDRITEEPEEVTTNRCQNLEGTEIFKMLLKFFTSTQLCSPNS
jgi:hypothetical protein